MNENGSSLEQTQVFERFHLKIGVKRVFCSLARWLLWCHAQLAYYVFSVAPCFVCAVCPLDYSPFWLHALNVCLGLVHAFYLGMAKFRKPHGEGKAALQRLRRKEVANKIAKTLFETMDLDEIEKKGVLFPKHPNLRKRRQRLMFQCLRAVDQCKGRIFTMKLCQLVCLKLIAMLPFRLNHDPRQDRESFLLSQANRLRTIATKAKRLTDNMDTVETQVWDARY